MAQVKGPEFVQFFGPVLLALDEMGGSGRPSEVRDRIVKPLGVPQSQQEELNRSGTPKLDNRIAWARFYLAKAGLIDSSERGVWRLTPDGQRDAPGMTHDVALELFQKVHQRWGGPASRRGREGAGVDEVGPPLAEVGDLTESSDYRVLFTEAVRGLSPGGFERFCQRLLREAGFEEVVVTGRSGDRGIDGVGILQVSPVMSMRVLFQCKRYSGVVGPSEVRDFRGAMMGRTDTGIVLTTGTFSAEARREAVREGAAPIELIDVDRLLELCERFGLGLSPVRTFVLDEPFFRQFN